MRGSAGGFVGDDRRFRHAADDRPRLGRPPAVGALDGSAGQRGRAETALGLGYQRPSPFSQRRQIFNDRPQPGPCQKHRIYIKRISRILLHRLELGIGVGGSNELKGDIYALQGNNLEARAAYQLAITESQSSPFNPTLLTIKLDSLVDQ